MAICQIGARIDLGDVVRYGGPRPNPELADKLRGTGAAALRSLAGPRAVARILSRCPCLGDFWAVLDAYRATPPRLSGEDLAELNRNGVTYPDLRRLSCPPVLLDWLGAYGRALSRALSRARRSAPGQRRRVRLQLPESFRPLAYPYGMSLVWRAADELPAAVEKLDRRVGELCRSVVRAHLSDHVRTGSVTPNPELSATCGELAAGVVTLLEDLACHADLLRNYRGISELLERSGISSH